MTEEEQAKQLYEQMFYRITPMGDDVQLHKDAKDCAVCAADWIIEELDEISRGESGTTKIDYGQSKWRRIKEVIESL